jgi:hypothetical protein
MKRLRICLFALLLISSGVTKLNAQAYSEGSHYITAGFGIGNIGLESIKILQRKFKNGTTPVPTSLSTVGPFFLKYEYALNPQTSIGINMAYAGAKLVASNGNRIDSLGNPFLVVETYRFSSLSVLFRVNYHLDLESEDFDPYVGASLGAKIGGTTYTTTDPRYTNQSNNLPHIPIGADLTLGTRYLLSKNIGVYGEFGIAKGLIQLGATLKL